MKIQVPKNFNMLNIIQKRTHNPILHKSIKGVEKRQNSELHKKRMSITSIQDIKEPTKSNTHSHQ